MRYIVYFTVACLTASLMLLAGCSAGRNAFSKGEQLEQEGNFEDAMYSYAEAFRKEPDAGEYRARFFRARQKASERRYRMGMEQQDRGDYVGALAELQTAYGIDPTQDKYKQQIEVVTRLRDAQQWYQEGRDFEKGNKLKDALRLYQAALELQPDNSEYKEGLARITGQRKSKLEGFELSLKSAKPITLKFKDAKIKDVFSIITQLTGINFIFDEGVKDQPISVYLENATFQQALDLLTNMHKLNRKILNESTVLIFPKSPEKSKQYEDLTLRTFHLSYMDAKKAVNLVRTMLQVKKIYVNEESNSIVIRDTADVVDVVERLLEANDVPDPEVVLEVEVLEISDKNTQNLGLLLSSYNMQLGAFKGTTPLSGSLNSVSTSSSGTTTTQASIDNLLNVFSMGGYSGFVTVPSAQYNFGKTLTKGEVLSNPKIRVKNKEKAKFNVGQRVPITTTTLNGTLSQVNVQYVDVGVKLNAEPNIQLNNEIIIKLGLEVSSILSKEVVGGSSSPTSVVTIGTRNLDTVLSLKDGETSIIGGLIQNTQNNTKQKVYLLSDLPLIGPLMSNNDTTKDKTELVLAITPRLVRSVTVPLQSFMAFGSGKEDDPTLVKPLGSFELEPVFEAPAKGQQPAKTSSPAAPVKPGQAAAAQKGAPPAVRPAPKSLFPSKQAAAPEGQGDDGGTDVSDPAQPAAQQNRVKPVLAPMVVPPKAPAVDENAPAAPESGAAVTAPVPGAQPVSSAAPPAPAVTVPAARRGMAQLAAPAVISPGQQFYVDVKVADIENLLSAPFVMAYDPNLVEFVTAAEGMLLKKDGKATTFSAVPAGTTGSVNVALSRAQGSSGVTGGGTIVSLLFKAKQKGTAGFSFRSVSFTTADGKPHEMLPFSTAVDVR